MEQTPADWKSGSGHSSQFLQLRQKIDFVGRQPACGRGSLPQVTPRRFAITSARTHDSDAGDEHVTIRKFGVSEQLHKTPMRFRKRCRTSDGASIPRNIKFRFVVGLRKSRKEIVGSGSDSRI
jgi:hypothetical protein